MPSRYDRLNNRCSCPSQKPPPVSYFTSTKSPSTWYSPWRSAIQLERLKLTLKFLFLLNLAAAIPACAQEILWPVRSRVPPPVVQGFAEFGDVSKAKYHTGIDLGVPLGTAVFPVADGEVVLIQLLSVTTDKGFGRTVVMRHGGSGQPALYSQYAHLGEIDTALVEACKPKRNASEVTLVCVAGVKRTTEDKIGNSGRSGFGLEDKWPPHLHLEFKSFGALCTSDAAGLVCGYSTAQPWTIGYLDPVGRLFEARLFPAPMPVIVTAAGVAVRFTPDAEQSKRPITVLEGAGSTVATLRGIAWSGGFPPCEFEGWIQVRRVDEPNCVATSGASTCFPDTRDPDLKPPDTYLGLIPTAWICAKYLSPLQVPAAREAVTEGVLFSGGSAKVERAGAQGLSIELVDRDGLFSVYEAAQLTSGAVMDIWSLIFLHMVYAAPPFKDFAATHRDLAATLLARYGAKCTSNQTPDARAACAVTELAKFRRIRIGGGRYDEGQRCVSWRDRPGGAPDCRPY